ncbi:hypothetical protein L218DRAFT_1081454 [Marasmius fiardii PR-910]|nr:hypothetical protein L218DRAFT_1081454 [Marasmius fiardii PR-910]
MFYPLPTPPDATYGAPDHWKADHITEYRCRRAVVRYWKDITDPKYSKDKEIPATRHNPLPDNDAAVDGVAGMTLDGPPPQSSDGDVPIPGPSDASLIISGRRGGWISRLGHSVARQKVQSRISSPIIYSFIQSCDGTTLVYHICSHSYLDYVLYSISSLCFVFVGEDVTCRF